MNILIIGPITGTTDYICRFRQAENELMLLYPHAHILNPCAIDMGGLPWEYYMKITLTMLKPCDAVYVLQDFEKSKGAMREYKLALRLHKRILFQEVRGE